MLLILLSVLVRIPFLRTFDLVAYDGPYYINLARLLLRGAYQPSVIPIGYPAFIALFIPLLRDGVRAAQAVSFLACIGSLIVFYSLCKQFVKRSHAFAASLILAITPLFIRLSMMTLSESVYIFWILLGLLFFARRRELNSGLCLGIASVTRPESIAILGVLAVLKIRKPKRLLLILAGFAVVYAVNVTVQSGVAGRLVLVPKTNLFGTSAESWKLREQTLEFSVKERLFEGFSKEKGEEGVLADYSRRLPQELMLLFRHASPVLFLLALYGICMRRLFLLALFVPFLFFPFLTVRSEPRYILPYIPGLVLYAFVGLERIKKHKVLVILSVLLAISAVTGLIVNRDQLIQPVSDGFQWAKRVGRSFRDRVEPGDRIADRKPYFAFYSGGEYFEIPIAPIDNTIEYLAANDVKYLILHVQTIHMLRPQLLPLMYDLNFIKSELRYSQVLLQPEVIIYRRELDSDPLERRRLVQSGEMLIYGPAWSRDGEKIACRGREPSGEGGIYVISPDGGEARRIIAETGIEDPITWAPDSKRIAFAANYEGNADIYIYNGTGEHERITSHEGLDISPSWSGDEMVFCSDRSGASDIWLKNLDTGKLTRITTGGGYAYPSISPDGKRIAYIRVGEGLFVLERGSGTVTRAEAPRRVNYAPAWSSDAGYIAVTANDWGKTDVYIVAVDGRDAVLLTKTTSKEGQPVWSPDDQSIATVTWSGNATGLCILTGIEPYVDRLIRLADIREYKSSFNKSGTLER